jgi:nucleoside-diphosphate-sugar epimerase
MPTRTVLLTGETGFLGTHLRRRLEADPTIETRLLNARLGELTPGPAFDVDVVIHLAAWTTKRAGTADLREMVSSNVLGLERLISCLDPPPRRLLFASSIDVYGLRSAERLHECSPLDPVDANATSKLLGEQMLLADAEERGYEVCAMRLGHLYGPGEDAYAKFVPTAIRALMKGRPPTVVGDGTTARDLLYVDDAAELCRRLALSPRELPSVVNVASSGSYTLTEIAEALIEIVGFLGEVRYLSDQPTPPSVGVDTRLLRETVGEFSEVSLAEGLRSEIEHVVANERSAATARLRN